MYIKPIGLLTAAEVSVAEAVRPVQAPRYSRDGKWIVFESWKNGNHDIYIMNANGTNLTQVTIDERVDYDPIWRP